MSQREDGAWHWLKWGDEWTVGRWEADLGCWNVAPLKGDITGGLQSPDFFAEVGLRFEREDWRCGTCSYWRKPAHSPWEECGSCQNEQVNDRARNLCYDRYDDGLVTDGDFGCRFWSRKPLAEQTS